MEKGGNGEDAGRRLRPTLWSTRSSAGARTLQGKGKEGKGNVWLREPRTPPQVCVAASPPSPRPRVASPASRVLARRAHRCELWWCAWLLLFLACCPRSPLLAPPIEAQHPDLVPFMSSLWCSLPPPELQRAVYPALSSYSDPDNLVRLTRCDFAGRSCWVAAVLRGASRGGSMRPAESRAGRFECVGASALALELACDLRGEVATLVRACVRAWGLRRCCRGTPCRAARCWPRARRPYSCSTPTCCSWCSTRCARRPRCPSRRPRSRRCGARWRRCGRSAGSPRRCAATPNQGAPARRPSLAIAMMTTFIIRRRASLPLCVVRCRAAGAFRARGHRRGGALLPPLAGRAGRAGARRHGRHARQRRHHAAGLVGRQRHHRAVRAGAVPRAHPPRGRVCAQGGGAGVAHAGRRSRRAMILARAPLLPCKREGGYRAYRAREGSGRGGSTSPKNQGGQCRPAATPQEGVRRRAARRQTSETLASLKSRAGTEANKRPVALGVLDPDEAAPRERE